mmetsp:Transcript_35264/g.63505  ORF Transcript_35264/g.63505 Transcript_35264/m.63505 type:complete len:222 (+) Transcript_35264:493-1158(+)
MTLDSRPYGPTAWVSHRRTVPSPPALRRVRPLRVQSTSKTGKPFLCPSSTIDDSPSDDALLLPFASCCCCLEAEESSVDRPSNDHIRTAPSSHPTATLRPSGGQMLADVIPTFGSSHGAGPPAPASASCPTDDEHSVANNTEGTNGSATCIRCFRLEPPFEDPVGNNPASYSCLSSNASNLRKPLTSSARLNSTADRASASLFPSSSFSSNRYFGKGNDSE